MRNNDLTDFKFPVEGQLKEGRIYPILYQIYKNCPSCVLAVRNGTCEKRMSIRDKKIVFASSDGQTDTFGDYLLKKQLISGDIFDAATRYMVTHKKRFGRALIELGFFTYDQIWTWVPAHMTSIVDSFFHIDSGSYRIMEDHNEHPNMENIVLDLDILSVIVEGMRSFKSESFLKSTFESVENLYVSTQNARLITQMDLKPYETHIFSLVKRESRLENILKWSELMEFDTLRLLYLFLALEIISTRKSAETPKPDSLPELDALEIIHTPTPRFSVFVSFEEALKYYNAKYEVIYKVMLKEIGPISLSILLKAIEDILDNLPQYFRKVRLNPDGTINQETILKALWYHDFDQHIGDFLRGLEEVLYTEIFAVKKHLGVECEQQVLKWIKGIGN